jgi:glycerophosphoryl diester phosphodiesterase
VANFSYHELLGFAVTNGANIKKHKSLKIPTLREALAVCEAFEMRPVVQVPDLREELLPRLARSLETARLPQPAILTSENRDTLALLRAALPKTELWLLTPEINEGAIGFCRQDGNMRLAFSANNPKNTDEKIKALVAGGTPAACWTVNDGDTLARMYRLGLRHAVTNNIVP